MNSKNTRDKQSDYEKVCAWLQEHPNILDGLKAMRDLSGVEGGGAKSVEEIEKTLLERLDDLGRQVIERWIYEKEKICLEKERSVAGTRRHSKKNCRLIRL